MEYKRIHTNKPQIYDSGKMGKKRVENKVTFRGGITSLYGTQGAGGVVRNQNGPIKQAINCTLRTSSSRQAAAVRHAPMKQVAPPHHTLAAARAVAGGLPMWVMLYILTA